MNASAAAPPSSSTKPQYLLSFAVIGSIVPYLSILLAHRGLSNLEIGYVTSAASLGVFFTPIFVTLLADTGIPGRYLMAALYAVAGLAAALMLQATTFAEVLVYYALHALAISPVLPLQDGIHFSAQEARKRAGLPEVPYHAARVWGTVGYIVPGMVLYFVLAAPGRMSATIWFAMAFCAAGLLYALLVLPATPPPPRGAARSRLPTTAAARAMAEPHVLVFCAAMGLAGIASAAYYYAYPLHLKQRAGVRVEWVGPVTNVGVVLEILFVLGFGWLHRRLGLRRVAYLGTLAVAARMFLLGAFPTPAVAIGTQLVHGLTVIGIGVVPQIFLNERAQPGFRNSIQGLYTMAFAGTGRIAGNLLAGAVANRFGLEVLFYTSAAIALAATALVYFAFDEK